MNNTEIENNLICILWAKIESLYKLEGNFLIIKKINKNND